MPSLSFADLPDWLQWITAATAILAGVVGFIAFVRKTWPVLKRFVLTVNSLQNLPEFMQRTDDTLAKQDGELALIKHEVQYNNGSSVKDAIRRVEQGVAGLYTRADASDAADKKLRKDIDEATHPVVHRTARRRQPPKKEN